MVIIEFLRNEYSRKQGTLSLSRLRLTLLRLYMSFPLLTLHLDPYASIGYEYIDTSFIYSDTLRRTLRFTFSYFSPASMLPPMPRSI